MTLAERLLQKLGDAFVQSAIKHRVRSRPSSAFDAFVVFRRPFLKNGRRMKVRLSTP
jgi:hypothetical protein